MHRWLSSFERLTVGIVSKSAPDFILKLPTDRVSYRCSKPLLFEKRDVKVAALFEKTFNADKIGG
jgi:hypothetical protein